MLGFAGSVCYSFSRWVIGGALILYDFCFVIGMCTWAVDGGAFGGVVSAFDKGSAVFLVVGIF